MIHKIKALYDEGRGLKIRAIARQLCISRNTVKKYLQMDEEAIQQQQSHRERSKRLDDHRDYIIQLLESFPGLSAVRVLRKLRQKFPALVVSDRTARRYINRLKETITLKQKRHYEPVLDMVPGVQCQVDGGELREVMIGGLERTVYFVVFVLSYSRLMYVALSQEPVNTELFIHMHDAAFRYFGGRPEECVYDQAKLVVLHEQYRELELNQQFHAYATGAGFRIHACEGYDPESKGKVEAGVKYVKQNGLYGELFDDWGHLEQHVGHWLNKIANVRIHGTTGESPYLRYRRDEQAHMAAYLTPAYLTQGCAPKESRKADKTGLISWKANKYSVPMAYQQARVGVREEGARLLLSDLETGKEIASHGLCQGRGSVTKNRDHYRDKREQIADLESAITQQLGNEAGSLLCTLLKQTSPRIYKDQLAGLKGLLKQHDISPALLTRLCACRSLTTTQIRDYLEAYATHPERLNDLNKQMAKPVSAGPQLTRYIGITLQRQEMNHAKLH